MLAQFSQDQQDDTFDTSSLWRVFRGMACMEPLL